MGSYTFGAITQSGIRHPRPDYRDAAMAALFGTQRLSWGQSWTPSRWRRTPGWIALWPTRGGSIGSEGDMGRASPYRTRRGPGGSVRLPYSIARTIRDDQGVAVPNARCMLFRSADNAFLREANSLLDGTVELRVEDNTTQHRMVVETNDGRTGATAGTVVGA